MNKYKSGGRCGGSTQTKETGCSTGSPSAQLSALLAARDAQDAAFSGQGSLPRSEGALPRSEGALPRSHEQPQTQAIIQVKKTQQTKSNDIDLILGGDLD